MTITCFHDDCILFERASGNFPLNYFSSNLLTVTRMDVKLGAYIVSMTTKTTNTVEVKKNFSKNVHCLTVERRSPLYRLSVSG